ncbi:alanyl-tRNA synthetase [Pullulanibacillus pueri]|uniref:Alanine--tRNA ligase n=1 Tax=Pullulanibacillus pueri TaxID=1437324 RepID=A0A8J2ZY95_9BACL|nr:alanine--tRNA ligase [Pullulanibacillus pueri]MBM7683243.1 alanyl-tRNA synthetase [Pullulanibacillus pueri]GGH85708.1 alanine--tRNA ligase [Pullulanibacillus pueri]
MKKLSSREVRQMFIDFFKEKGHRVEPSASLIPHEDPTLLWINSGVATLKKYFDGRVVPENPRIVNAQKAIRTNDIENVGYTARHHTFFEMLGNFSVGDYFKEEAIQWAWEFLTSPKWIGFDPKYLSVTIHPEDDEAFDLWHKTIGLPKERIIRLEENFWDIGEGPSGPNTEIFYDRGEAYGNDPEDPELYPGGENERYLEIWNLVFSQFNHNPDGTYTPLPKKNIDTGMGLERMVSVIQEAKTNYDTDLFLPLIQKIEVISGKTYGETKERDTAFKVITDHVRAVSFAVSDGALPSNEGRGYVLRRLIRRAVRFAMELGIERPFMYELVPIVTEIMGEFYDNLKTQTALVQKIIRTEEERFHETLHEGLAILKDVMAKAKAANEKVIAGTDVFKLYDTFGFPVELTEEYAENEGFTIDHEGFEKELNAQRDRARQARQTTESMQVQNETLREITVESEFIGYSEQESDSKVAIIVNQNEVVDFAKTGDVVQIILDKTPFYAESGGQVADKGKLVNQATELLVQEVKKAPNGQNLHTVRVEKGNLKKGDVFKAEIQSERRSDTEKNHTATHLLHQALKDVLGTHVNQAGSLVTPERLRFDFSHFDKVTEEELNRVEEIVNEKIWQSLSVETMQKGIKEAKAMGAMALFGEKYGDIVRVVRIGDYSLELCGGCHVRNTSAIGLFKIVSESGIGAGTRRIEAVTGKYAFTMLNRHLKDLQHAAQLLKTTIDGIPERIEGFYSQIHQLEKEKESLISKLGNTEINEIKQMIQEVEGIPFVARKIEGQDMNGLRAMIDKLKEQLPSAVLVLASVKDGKVNIACGVTKDLIEKGFHAGKLVKEIATRCGGGGGGRPDMAQAGGKNPEALDNALAFVEQWVSEQSLSK